MFKIYVEFEDNPLKMDIINFQRIPCIGEEILYYRVRYSHAESYNCIVKRVIWGMDGEARLILTKVNNE